MKLTTIIVFIIVALVFFGAGYIVADRRSESLVAEKEFAALLHDVAAISYLRKGSANEAKNILYTAIDGSLSTLSQDQAVSLTPSSREHLAKVLSNLNQAWVEDEPFDETKTSSLRDNPEWEAMRKRNDDFRRDFARNK